MSNTNITKEVDELVSLAFRFVNQKGKSTIEETIDCIRQAKSCIEDEAEVINELARTNFGKFNRVRDFFVKNYSRFKKYKIKPSRAIPTCVRSPIPRLTRSPSSSMRR